MRSFWRDKDLVMVLGCLAVGLLQVRAQRALLRALRTAAERRQASDAASLRTSPQPMRYDRPGAAAAAARFGVDHGMN